MADNAIDDDGGSGKDKKGKKKNNGDKGGRSNLVPAIILAVGMVLGGKFMGGGGGGQAAAAPAEQAEAAAAKEGPKDCATEDIKKPPKEGGVHALEPITVNLQDGHYLKVGIALKLSATMDPKKMEKEGLGVMALDPTIAVLGGRKKEEFESARAIAAAKREITELVRPMYECKVIDVLFTEFVVQ